MDADSGALSPSARVFASLFWDSDDGLVINDLVGRVVAANPGMSKLLGCTVEEMLRRPAQDFVDPDDAREHPMRLDDLREGRPVVAEQRLRRRDGSLVPVEITAGRLPDGQLVAIVRDITERKRALEALQAGGELLRATMEAVADGILAVDDHGAVILRNARFADMWHIPQEIAESRDDARLLGFVLDQLEDPEAFLAKVKALYRSTAEDFDVLHFKDGRIFERFSCPLMHGEEIGGRVWSFRDVTERRRAERERLELERQVLQAQKMESLGVLAGGIAHDFNNLLMTMLGNLELALRDLSPVSPARPRIEAAVEAARGAADLTRKMLAYSGRGAVMVERLDLSELVEENVHLLRNSLPATTTLDLQLARPLPAIGADAGQLQQAVVNLFTNAAEAIGSGPGVITLATGVCDCDAAYLAASRLEPAPPAGRFVFLEVRDTGCGMDPQVQRRLFEPFFTTKFTGRGLGMAAVLGIVQGHHGAILLESAPGQGTAVRVLFPPVADALAGGSPA